MRHARLKAEGAGCYHVVSRIVDAVFERNRSFFGPRRKDGARSMRFAD